ASSRMSAIVVRRESSSVMMERTLTGGVPASISLSLSSLSMGGLHVGDGARGDMVAQGVAHIDGKRQAIGCLLQILELAVVKRHVQQPPARRAGAAGAPPRGQAHALELGLD